MNMLQTEGNMPSSDARRFDRIDQKIDNLVSDVREVKQFREELSSIVGAEMAAHLQKERDGVTGLRKIGEFLKTWSLTAAAITVPITLLGFAIIEIKQNSEFRGATNQRLVTIEKALDRLVLKAAAERPLEPENQQAAKDVLARSIALNSPLAFTEIKNAGEQFLRTMDPTAWDVGLQFVSYRSRLNASLPSPTLGLPRFQEYKWEANIVTDDPPQISPTVLGNVSRENAAAIEVIGSPLNVNQDRGPALVVLTGKTKEATVVIDGLRIKNILFQNVKIQYSGGATRLESVSFLNCTFRFQQLAPAEMLAQQILSSTSVSFAD